MGVIGQPSHRHETGENSRIKQWFMLVFLMCFGSNAQAQLHRYQASLDSSTWTVGEQSKLKCSLSHAIPLYGSVTISQQAGKKIRLYVKSLQGNRTRGKGSLSINAPNWRYDVKPQSLGKVPLYPSQNVVRLHDRMVWRVVVALQEGLQPTFSYPSWFDRGHRVQVSLSPVNFQSAFTGYQQCADQLLAYGFDDVARSVLYFAAGRIQPSPRVLKTLDRIVNYLKYDEVSVIRVRSYTDSHGTRRENYLLSVRRAKAVKQYLLAKGIAEEKIDVMAYGERRPVVSNKTKKGRAKNRRVTVTLER